jgi:transcription elongation factor Elf1
VEFRCSNCGHLGSPGEVRSTDEGTVVVCAECGHGEPLEASEATDPAEPSVARDEIEEALRTVRAGGDGASTDSASGPIDWEATQEHLVPDTEPGPRCPKCIAQVDSDCDHCPHCGLGLTDRDLLDPDGSDAIVTDTLQPFVREEADERWETVLTEETAEAFEAYVEWMTDHGGDDEAIRRVRYYLVAHPDHQPALDALASLSDSVRSRLVAARAKAESESEAFQSDVSRFRRYVIGGLAVFWTLALALALYLVFG